MTTRVGNEQLRTLIMLGSPTMILLTSDRSTRALVRRGLLRRETKKHDATVITAAGLRALADAMDDGRVAKTMAAMKRELEERRAKAEAKRGLRK